MYNAFLPLFMSPFLYLLARVFACILMLRAKAYSAGILRRTKAPLATLCIGNISLGGTGKTPMVDTLIAHLRTQNKKVWLLSRGYKRKNRGYKEAQKQDNALSLGDEAYMLYRRYAPWLKVALCTNRAYALQKIAQQTPKPDLVIMDDGYQHRSLKATFYILLCDYTQPVYQDTLWPKGRLREPLWAMKYANIVVITKCPTNVSPKERQDIQEKIAPLCQAPLFFASLQYDIPRAFDNKQHTWHRQAQTWLISGVATPILFEKQAAKHAPIEHIKRLPDHAHYSKKLLTNWLTVPLRNQMPLNILTTEKDAVKIKPIILQHKSLQKFRWFYLPVRLKIHQEAHFYATLKTIGIL